MKNNQRKSGARRKPSKTPTEENAGEKACNKNFGGEGAAQFVEVALKVPINHTFTYSSDKDVTLGSYVEVPFGSRTQKGFVLRVSPTVGPDCPVGIDKILPIKRLIGKGALCAQMIECAKWISDYYLCSIGEAAFLFLAPKGFYESFQEEQGASKEKSEGAAELEKLDGAAGKKTDASLSANLNENIKATRALIKLDEVANENTDVSLSANLDENINKGLSKFCEKTDDVLNIKRDAALNTNKKPIKLEEKALERQKQNLNIKLDTNLSEGFDSGAKKGLTEFDIRGEKSFDGSLNENSYENFQEEAALVQNSEGLTNLDAKANKNSVVRLSKSLITNLSESSKNIGLNKSFESPCANDSKVFNVQNTTIDGPLGTKMAGGAIKLSDEQQKAVSLIAKSLGTYCVHYLYGITGSGKTEVFLQAAQKALLTGGSVLYLVPEISLTAQSEKSTKERFGETVAVIHSSLTTKKRRSEYERIRKGEARFIIGARSAIFTPIQNLALIIVDEEHEGSYKSSTTPRYNARQIAFHIAKVRNIPLVFGSATPSVESYKLMENGTMTAHTLTKRLSGGELPKVSIVNMKGVEGVVSNTLEKAIWETLAAKKQVILFLNRRGFSSLLVCASCGTNFICPRCSVPMTYHKSAGKLLCHYCGSSQKVGYTCPSCGSPSLASKGFGTEYVEEVVKLKFPSARVLRIDSDSIEEGNIENEEQDEEEKEAGEGFNKASDKINFFEDSCGKENVGDKNFCKNEKDAEEKSSTEGKSDAEKAFSIQEGKIELDTQRGIAENSTYRDETQGFLISGNSEASGNKEAGEAKENLKDNSEGKGTRVKGDLTKGNTEEGTEVKEGLQNGNSFLAQAPNKYLGEKLGVGKGIAYNEEGKSILISGNKEGGEAKEGLKGGNSTKVNEAKEALKNDNDGALELTKGCDNGAGLGGAGKKLKTGATKKSGSTDKSEGTLTGVAKFKRIMDKKLKDFSEGKADILLGTQMIAKGLNFQNVALVGVVMADTTLRIADFRSAERTYALITQVAGRAGRYQTGGRVIVQTYCPDSPVLRYAAAGAAQKFYEWELAQRRDQGFPPYSRLIRLTYRSRNSQKCLQVAKAGVKTLQSLVGGAARVLGPASAVVFKVKFYFRYTVILVGTFSVIHKATKKYLDSVKKENAVYLEVDVDASEGV